MKRVLLLALACAACGGDGGEEPSQRLQYERARAVRAALYKVKAAPGGAIALFKQVRLHEAGVVCGVVDAQDGDGSRRFSVSGDEVTVEQPGDTAALRIIEATCRGPAREATSRNEAFTDITVAHEPS